MCDGSPANSMAIAQIVTVRLVRSFEYKTVRTLYLKDVDLESTTLEHLKKMVDERTYAKILILGLFFVRSAKY